MAREARVKPVAFYMNGKILDWNTGLEYHDPSRFDTGGPIICDCQGTLFETWIDDTGERNWKVVK